MSETPTLAKKLTKRIVFIDVARSVAILLALTDHSLKVLGVYGADPFDPPMWANYFAKPITQVASPTFILLFGAMLELVYVRRLERDGFGPTAKRLFQRACLCYAGYAITVLCSAIGNHGFTSTIKGTLGALAGFGHGRFGNVLKFYAVAILLAIPMLAIRRRWGLWPLVLGAVVVWAGITPLMDYLARPDGGLYDWPNRHNKVSKLMALFIGRPERASTFSVMHGMTLVVVGFLVGWSVSPQFGQKRRLMFYKVAAAISVVLVAIVGYLVWQHGASEVFSRYVGVEDKFYYRNLHHIGYYAISAISALVALLIFCQFLPPGTEMHERWTPLLAFGQYAIVAFTVGNCVLVMMPETATAYLANHVPLAGRLALVAVYVAGLATFMGLYAMRQRRIAQREKAAAAAEARQAAKPHDASPDMTPRAAGVADAPAGS